MGKWRGHGYPATIVAAACSAVAGVGARGDINGFGNGAGFTVNNNTAGAASINAGTLTLTTGVNSQASTVFNNTPQSVGNFTASFTYTDVSTGGADGFAFLLHNDPRGLTALGADGGALGYGGGSPITPSAAVNFNIYDGNGGSRVGFSRGGNVGYSFPNTGAVNLTNGQPVNVTINYATVGSAGVISATLTQGGNTFTTRPQAFNVTSYVGGNTAIVGVGGGTGGLNASQTLSNFSFTSGTAAAPAGKFNVIQATDSVTQINGTQFPNGDNGTFAPGAEGVTNATDKGVGSKYLNFGGAGSGLTVTPGIGSTVVTGLVLTSANDAPERDPASYLIRGSNDGTNFTDIFTGSVPAFSGRFVEQELTFPNTVAYTTYQVVFPTVADSTTNNSMQIGEVQLMGVGAPVPEPGSLALLGLLGAATFARRRRS
jgi:hypothetical protein